MTATQAGEALGESPANVSFHLRTLAKYGFVEEAPGGTGRQRPWRRVAQAHVVEARRATTRRRPPRPRGCRGSSTSGSSSAGRRGTPTARVVPEGVAGRVVRLQLDHLPHGRRAGGGRRGDRRDHRPLRRPRAPTGRSARRAPCRSPSSPPATPSSRPRPATDGSYGAAVGDPVHGRRSPAGSRARGSPVDERERASIERFLAEVPRLDAPVRRARRSRARHRLGARSSGRAASCCCRHKSLGIWVQPGGHIDAGETAVGGRRARGDRGDRARRSACSAIRPSWPTSTCTPGRAGTPTSTCGTSLDGGDADPAPPPEESQDVAWFDWPDAAIAVAEPGMRRRSLPGAGRAFGYGQRPPHGGRAHGRDHVAPSDRRGVPRPGRGDRRRSVGRSDAVRGLGRARARQPRRRRGPLDGAAARREHDRRGRRPLRRRPARRRSRRRRRTTLPPRRSPPSADHVPGRRDRSTCPTATRTWPSTSTSSRPTT